MEKKLLIGWEQTDITPDGPVCLCGQFHARISEGVLDPITSTVCVFHSTKEKSDYVIMVSCDLVAISYEFRKAILKKLHVLAPEIDGTKIVMNATHTHTAPEPGGDILRSSPGTDLKEMYGIELPCMGIGEYLDFVSGKIAQAIKNAWDKKQPGGISYGLGFAVVGFNRRISYFDGTSVMYGKTDVENFSHVEGYEDHSINLVATCDEKGMLTGLIINIACPSQVDEHLYQISADYWHDVRQEIRERFGNVYLLSQCSSAGDQSPHILINKQAHQRMWSLAGRTERQEIATKIADGIEKILPVIRKEIKSEVEICNVYREIEVERNRITQEELEKSIREAEKFYKEYERLKVELDQHPEKKSEPRWYRDITYNYRRYSWFNNVRERYQLQSSKIKIPVYVIKLGDIVFATNPFECFLDHGIQIKARSPFIQTFIVQLAGGGSYLPTERAKKSGSYSAIAPSIVVGPEGARQMVNQTLEIIKSLWKK